MLTFSGGAHAGHRLRFGSPAALIPLALVGLVTAAAFGSPSSRDSLSDALRFDPARGLLQHGLFTHWLVETSSFVAVLNAAYALLTGLKLQADLGRVLAFAMFLLGAVAGVAGQLAFGQGTEASSIVGASGALALWMGMAAVPYSLAAPEVAWGTVQWPALRLRIPFVWVIVIWFVHQGMALVLNAGHAAAGQHNAARLAEFGLGIGLGLLARWLVSLFPAAASEDNSEELRPDAAATQLAQALDMTRKKPRLAVHMLRRLLREDRRNLDASLALIEALSVTGDTEAMVDEAVGRIAVLMRSGHGRRAATVYERMRERRMESLVVSRLSATITSALMDALVKDKAPKLAEQLGQEWCTANARDQDGWRVREALAALREAGR